MEFIVLQMTTTLILLLAPKPKIPDMQTLRKLIYIPLSPT